MMITFVELRNLSYTWQTPVEKEMKRSVNDRLYRFRHYPDFVKPEEYNDTRYINTGGWIQFLIPHLKGNDFEVVWFNGDEESKQKLKSMDSDIVLISIMTLNYQLAKEAIQSIDRKRTKVIIGGVHPTLNPEETVEDLKPDALVVGEADHTIEEIINNRMNGKAPSSPGVIYIDPNTKTVKKTDMANVLSPVEEIKLDWSMHLKYTDGVNKFLPIIIASRDCPYACNFCSIVKTRRFRLLPLEKVIQQITDLQQKVDGHPLHVMFEDPIFFGDINYTEKLVEALKGLNITWDCQNRVEKPTERKKDLYRKMAEAGCRAVYFGVESSKQHVINDANKKFKVENIYDCLRTVREAGILAHAGFMVGFPSQTRQDVEDDLTFAIQAVRDNVITTIEYFFLSVYPGSMYSLYPERFGLELHDFRDFAAIERKVRHNTKHLRHDEIWNIYLEGCRRITEAHDKY